MPQFILALFIALSFSIGTFLILRRDLFKVLWGIVVLSQSANLFIISVGGISGKVPVISGHETYVIMTDPLVQALVLTAIVIGLGTTAFALVLILRVYEECGTLDLDQIWGGI